MIIIKEDQKRLSFSPWTISRHSTFPYFVLLKKISQIHERSFFCLVKIKLHSDNLNWKKVYRFGITHSTSLPTSFVNNFL